MDLLTANDPGIDAVLATHAHAGMDEHGDEKSRLPLGESELRNGPKAITAIETAFAKAMSSRTIQ